MIIKNIFLIVFMGNIFNSLVWIPRHDTQYNDTQYNDTQYNDTQYNDTQYDDTQHNKKTRQ